MLLPFGTRRCCVMWRPPERIRYSPRPGRWPTAREAAAARLFLPVRVGTLQLEQRTWVPAMVPWRANEAGFVTAEVIEWYGRFARGAPGAIVVEATGIRDIPSGPLLRIGDDRFIPGLRTLVETVRAASGGRTKLLIQLIDFLTIRRRPDPLRFLREFLTVTDEHRRACPEREASDERVRSWLQSLNRDCLADVLSARELEALDFGYREHITDEELPHIRDLPATLPVLFADAAVRARQAGFDGVELHYAHAYTMASFLSPTNSRKDGYGGAREQRIRLPLEVYERVRRAAGPDFTVGCRFLAEECIAGGGAVEDAEYFAVQFACHGMDFLSLSRGGKFDDAGQPKIGEAAYPYTGPSGYECMPSYYSDARGPFSRNVEPVARVRAALRRAGLSTPIIVSGGIHGFEAAESILRRGDADIIGFARQALADPDWFCKVSAGRGREVRVCLYTNYCEALDQRHRQVTCELWDRDGLEEPGVKLSNDGRRRLTAPIWNPTDR